MRTLITIAIVGLLIIGAIALGVKFAIENIPEFGGPPDYIGEGTDQVVIVVGRR